MNNKNYMGD